MGSGQVALSKRLHLRGVIQGGGALGSRSAQSKRDLYILGRLGERQDQWLGLHKEHAFHGIWRRGNLQLGFILRKSLKQPSPRYRHSLPKREIKDRNKICQRDAHRRAYLLQHPRDRVRRVAWRVTVRADTDVRVFFRAIIILSSCHLPRGERKRPDKGVVGL